MFGYQNEFENQVSSNLMLPVQISTGNIAELSNFDNSTLKNQLKIEKST